MTTQTTPHSSEHYETIKLGIDAHAQWYHVSRQVDGATPQPCGARISFETRFMKPKLRLRKVQTAPVESHEPCEKQRRTA